MAIKKSELYSSLWKGCDALRGGMDASQYKDYVLALLFVKYVSDKYAGQPQAVIHIPAGGGFADMVALKGDKEIGDKLNKIISALAGANNLKGVIDVADFNDSDKLGNGKEMQDRLANLVGIFEHPGLNFRNNRAEGDDILGDAYEYLMRHFATESGKSKGQFYTPAEVSRVIAKVIGITPATPRSHTIYDPTCGSGSLLLKAADEASNGLSIYGQEMDNATAALATMNMILHNNPAAEIRKGNTLAMPEFLAGDALKTFDFAVANPPFSSKAWNTGVNTLNDPFERFADGVPPDKNGDYAFLLHVVRSLKSTGKGAVILPHGVLFRGNAESRIRRNLVQRGYIKGIIGLPANLFYGTGIPACIIVLDKEHAANRSGIWMLDASKGFAKDGNKNRLRHQDIHKIVDVFNNQIEVPKYARMVSRAEIAANDYNLNLPRYIDSSEPEDLHDIAAHLHGGIPPRDIAALAEYWRAFPTLKQHFFAPAERPGYSVVRVEAAQVKPLIMGHREFVDYHQTVTVLFEQWKHKNKPRLENIGVGSHPKAVIAEIAEDLLAIFSHALLVDRYDVYQHLMSYWSATMQDDVYLIAFDGWKASPDLIPPRLIIKRYFQTEHAAIEQLEARRDDLTRRIEEMDEEHGAEGGALDDARNEKGKITKGSVKTRLKDLPVAVANAEERRLLDSYLTLLDQEAEASKRIKDAHKALDSKVAAKYQHLSVDEIKALVVSAKWLAAIADTVQAELNRISQALSGRITLLSQRYATPLPDLVDHVAELSERVTQHLQRMGFR